MTPEPLRIWTILLLAQAKDGQRFHTSYEVIAPDERAAARFALADLAARGETAVDVEHAEMSSTVHPMAPQGVRFRTGRMYFEG